MISAEQARKMCQETNAKLESEIEKTILSACNSGKYYCDFPLKDGDIPHDVYSKLVNAGYDVLGEVPYSKERLLRICW